MSESKVSPASPDLWIRLVYMVVFWLLSFLARIVIAIVAILQFLVVLFTGEINHNLRDLGAGIAIWTRQNYDFLSFASDSKPFPFQDWPTVEGDNQTDTEEPVVADSDTDPAPPKMPD
jgi:Domain of unknown function (DUF4389)